MNNNVAYSGQQGCVTIPDRKCKLNTPIPDWAKGQKLVSKFLFNKTDIEHLRRGSDWAALNDPEQKYTAFRIIECDPVDTGKCVINGEYSHIKFINAGPDLENGYVVDIDKFFIGELPKWTLTADKLLILLKASLDFIKWLKVAHNNGFSHNDIKASNICFDGSNMRLIDFSDRTHTVWNAVFKSKGFTGQTIVFDNNKDNRNRQIKDIRLIRELFPELFKTLMEQQHMSLKFAQALKIATHILTEEITDASAEEYYNNLNLNFQEFLSTMINMLNNIKQDELFTSDNIDYRGLSYGRKFTPAELKLSYGKKEDLRKELKKEAFMSWTEKDDELYVHMVALLPGRGGRRGRGGSSSSSSSSRSKTILLKRSKKINKRTRKSAR
jgi:hypothetical protein